MRRPPPGLKREATSLTTEYLKQVLRMCSLANHRYRDLFIYLLKKITGDKTRADFKRSQSEVRKIKFTVKLCRLFNQQPEQSNL